MTDINPLSSPWKYFIIILVLLICVQCKPKTEAPPPKIDQAFTGYISAFTSGVISNQSTIRIELRNDVPGIEINSKLEKGIFKFSPSIKGEAYWTGRRNIEFRPEEQLSAGQQFDVKFHLSKIIDVPEKLKTLSFRINSKEQMIDVVHKGTSGYGDNSLEVQKLTGNFRTSDFARSEVVEKLFTAEQNSKTLNIKWNHTSDGLLHEFIVDSVRRTKSKSEVILKWDGAKIGSNNKGDKIIPIPPIGNFNVVNCIVTQQPSQLITVYFSDPLNKDQDINGLIRLKSGAEVRLVKDGFEVKVYPNKRLNASTELIVNDGVRNALGYQLKETYKKAISFSSLKPSVSLIGTGVILPSSNGLIFPFKAVNLSAVNVKIVRVYEENVMQFFQVNQFDDTREMKRVGRIVFKEAVPLTSDKNIDYGESNTFSLDLSKLIETEPGAIYRVSIGFDRSQSLYVCNEIDSSTEEKDFLLKGEDPEIASFDHPNRNYYYRDYYYDYNDGFNYKEQHNPCKKSYYMRGKLTVSRNVFASDLGIIAKGGSDNKITVAITDLKTTDPLSGIEVEIYNYQQQLMAKATTDAKGFVTIDLSSKPFLLVAKSGKQRGYLRLDESSALSYSMFDIGGQKIAKGVKGYIYGERGVWRPGDSLFISFILEDKNDVIPEDHPIVFELYTPDNQIYLKNVKTNSINGIYNFSTHTKPEAPTGNWLAKVKVGGASFTKTIKVETVKPNRLKIKFDFEEDILRKSSTPKAELEVKWLHGAIAKNLKTDVNLTLSKGKTIFDAYPDYIFDNPAKTFDTQENKLFEGTLDESGKATVNAIISVGDNAPGMIKANFKIRAFEKGGEFSTDQFSIPYSPFKSYVGIKVPKGEGWNGALYTDKSNLIPIVTVDEFGKSVDRKVSIQIYNINWRWWWERSIHDDLARYVRNQSRNIIKTDAITTKNGKAMYDLKIPQGWGRKLIIVTDPISGHSTGQLFYTSYSSWWRSSNGNNPGGAEMLVFKTDKDEYNVGEDVVVELPASTSGKALVSIESGSKVIDVFWIKPTAENPRFSFKASAEMAPNVYVNISFLQAHNQLKNDLPIRMYGVQNVNIVDPKTHLKPVISMPDVLEPEQTVTIKVSEENSRNMTYTLALVEDGLLDLTRFKTPDAWKSFYVREALGVKSWDMYKYVMGAFTGELSGLLAIGGDEELSNKGGTKANRFKPVVRFIGPFELKSGSNTHKITLPNYVGSVRTMVVAAQDGAYGKAEKTTPVKKPLMVLSTLPRVLGPTEKVKLPVTVFAMEDKIKEVTVSVETNETISLNGGSEQIITFNEQGEKVINFDLNVKEKIGVAKVKVIAKCGNIEAVHEIELDVRIPNPEVTEILDEVIGTESTWETHYAPVGIKGTNSIVLEISSIPPLDLEKRLKYLIRYPHGCIEQTTSSVFPQLHLASLLKLDDETKVKIEENILAGIDRLRSFQLSDGGLSYWPGHHDNASEWGTNYAGHFMLEAKAKGYHLPDGFISNWMRYQKKRANEWDTRSSGSRLHYYNSSQLIQAYRLYTLALAGEPVKGAMNRMRELNNLTTAARWRLAAAYFIIGQERVAKELIQNYTMVVKEYKELSYSYGSSERDQAMILEALVLMNEQSKAKTILDELSQNLSSSRWYSTQTTAYSLLAIAKFVGTTGTSEDASFTYSINQGEETKVSMSAPISLITLENKDLIPGEISVKNNSEKVLFTKIIQVGKPLIGDQINNAKDLKMLVTYKDLAGNALNPEQLEQGTDFMATVEIHHPGVRMDYQEMALTQIFPSGWEIRNLRMEDGPSTYTADKPTYEDIRDDRVHTYFDIRKNETKTFVVLLNASYQGKFYLPTIYCEAMYDNEIYARKAGRWIEVLPSKK